MALTERERRYLDERADEMAAELARTDPGLVHALTRDPNRRRRLNRVVIQVLLLVSLPLAVVGVGLVEPIVFVAACLSLLTAACVALQSLVRRRFGTGR